MKRLCCRPPRSADRVTTQQDTEEAFMAGILDKIKAMLGGAKSKVGDKVPDTVKDIYEKASDKVESVIPGDSDGDEGATADESATTEARPAE